MPNPDRFRRHFTFEKDGEVYHIGIHAWLMEEMTPYDFYVTGALLSDSIALSDKFEAEKRRPLGYSLQIYLKLCRGIYSME